MAIPDPEKFPAGAILTIEPVAPVVPVPKSRVIVADAGPAITSNASMLAKNTVLFIALSSSSFLISKLFLDVAPYTEDPS
jgi:hypothetical protein